MKITVKNIIENWDKIKGQLSQKLINFYNETHEFFDLYDDADTETVEKIDMFIEMVNAELDSKKQEKQPAEKPKTTKKTAKTKVNPKKKYFLVLENFVKMAGKNKRTYIVRKFVDSINTNFNAKLGLKTEHIDLIKQVREVLFDLANSQEKIVAVPKNTDLVKRCKEAMRDKNWTYSSKIPKEKLEKPALSGLLGFLGLDKPLFKDKFVNPFSEKKKSLSQEQEKPKKEKVSKRKKKAVKSLALGDLGNLENLSSEVGTQTAPPVNKVLQRPDEDKYGNVKLSFIQEQNYEDNFFDFTGQWKDFLGKPKKNFHLILTAAPGNGKSTFAIKFAIYLANNFGKVLYLNNEEDKVGINYKLNKVLKEPAPENFDMNFQKKTMDELKKIFKANDYRFLFLDSLQACGYGLEEIADFKNTFPEAALVVINTSNKEKDISGSQQQKHQCDIVIVGDSKERGVLVNEKNRQNGGAAKYYVFGKEGE